MHHNKPLPIFAILTLVSLVACGVPQEVKDELEKTRKAALDAATIARDALDKVAQAVPGERTERLVFAMNGPDGPEKETARKVVRSLFRIDPDSLGAEATVSFESDLHEPLATALFVGRSNLAQEVDGFVRSGRWRPTRDTTPAVRVPETPDEVRSRIASTVRASYDTLAGRYLSPSSQENFQTFNASAPPNACVALGAIEHSGFLFENHFACYSRAGELGGLGATGGIVYYSAPTFGASVAAMASNSDEAARVREKAAIILTDAIVNAYATTKGPPSSTEQTYAWNYIIDRTPVLFVLIDDDDFQKHLHQNLRAVVRVHKAGDASATLPNMTRPITLDAEYFATNNLVKGQLSGQKIRWATINIESRNVASQDVADSIKELNAIIDELGKKRD